MSLAMSRTQREGFLAETRVAIISMQEAGRGPLTLPIWYNYEVGGVARFVTGPRSKKAALIREAGRLSLCVQTETPPYMYVSVEEPAIVADEVDFERDVRQVAYRYLGEEMGQMYLTMTAEQRQRDGSVLVVLTPERWLSVDYNKMAGG